ncbi:MAG: metalloregulator ArsR/SmtB family transcription factor [Sandaracinaceae bacterium]|nr:metalloregulator ArsR/SmtB family transcription factor [Sandaracinaceae bacterium]
MSSLSDVNALCGLLADPTRVRLLALLTEEELSVAELTDITGLPQSRVSTHLGKLRDAGLVALRRQGSSTFHRAHGGMPPRARSLWEVVRAGLDDALLVADRERCAALVRAREAAWPDAVAGQMERHYSPGRTWEATARGFLGLARFGDVLDAGSGDGTLAALIAPRARSVTCVDRSDRVLEAAARRLEGHANVTLRRGDLHELPADDASFDTVMLFNVLTYARRPERVLAEAARVLRPGGQVAIITLAAHEHTALTEGFGHLVPGFEPAHLRGLLEAAGLLIDCCEITSRERRKPHFSVISAFAHRSDS